MIKVSVISPIYNREQWVENLLNNLQSQTLKEIEFIIVDDGSSDKTYELLQAKTKGDNRFQIMKSPENKGPYHARNIGLAQAKGEYIGFFDCDDKIPKDYFESLYEQAKAESADIVYGIYNNIPHRIKKIQSMSDKFKVLKNGAIWDKLYRKEYLDTNHISFTEGLYTADNLFILQAFLQTDNIVLTGSPNYEYKLQEDSIGKDETKQAKRKKDILEVLQKALVLRDTQSLTEDALYEYERFLIRSLCDYPKDKQFQTQFYKILGIKNKPEKEISMKLAVLKFIRLFHLISKEKYNKKRQIELVKASDLFDTKWYLAVNCQVWVERRSQSQSEIRWQPIFMRLSGSSREGDMPARSLHHQWKKRRKVLQQYQRRDKPTANVGYELVWKIALCIGISDTFTRRMRPPQGRNQSIRTTNEIIPLNQN